MEKNKGKIFLNTLLWGLALWAFGYIVGMIMFAIVPKEFIGWATMPFGLIALFWVLFKKIKRDSFVCYIGLGIIWTVLAVILDYIFIVKMLSSNDYYKLDVYLYYILTLIIPIVFGWLKMKKTKIIEK